MVDAKLNALMLASTENRLIETEYPYNPKRRPFEKTFAGCCLIEDFQSRSREIENWLGYIHAYEFHTKGIAKRTDDPANVEPSWINRYLPGLDGMLLYTIVSRLRPETYLEVGSGISTKFVRRAIRDGGLSTRIVSIDPCPRAPIDNLCDQVIRKPLEDVPESTYQSILKTNDVVFVDNSHRSFMNSDVTVFVTEILPILPRGTTFGIHDICLPFDYPQKWTDRYYNEQYLIAAYLLGGHHCDEIIFPAYYVSFAPEYQQRLNAIFGNSAFDGVERHGCSLWMRRSRNFSVSKP